MGVLAVLFLSASIAEIAVLLLVESRIGFAWILILILATGVGGAYLVTRQGMAMWRLFLDQLRAGIVPARPVAEGAMVVVGGALLLTPGFITDTLGLTLMIPALRERLLAIAVRYLRNRLRV